VNDPFVVTAEPPEIVAIAAAVDRPTIETALAPEMVAAALRIALPAKATDDEP
jgi:hypothetical protein